jgi:2-C-methyl-D-erythritol 2,4-cyclodiphosphate synthase
MSKSIPMGMRIGQGFDVHKFADDRRLVLGGVEIPYHLGLLGHSDADVLFHAISDALLGAAALGDIGQHFPPSDARYKDADSGELMVEVWQRVQKAGITRIGNIDCVVMAQEPMLAKFIPRIRANIARLLEIDMERVSVKATTCDRLGFVGREEGMAASAICLLITDE